MDVRDELASTDTAGVESLYFSASSQSGPAHHIPSRPLHTHTSADEYILCDI